MKTKPPARSHSVVLKQLRKRIPRWLIGEVARETGAEAAAKMHLRLHLHSFLPSFAIVDTAGEHDNKRARKVDRDQMVLIDGGRIVRRVEVWVEVDNAERLMVLITNNPTWSPTSVACEAMGQQVDPSRYLAFSNRRGCQVLPVAPRDLMGQHRSVLSAT